MPLVGGMIGIGIGSGLEKYPAGPTVISIRYIEMGNHRWSIPRKCKKFLCI
jgi:hypothetical protein